MKSEHEKFMRLALEEARKGEAKGNPPVGSIIVRDLEIISYGHNLAISELDLTAHAETVALRRAGIKLGNTDLSGSTLYTTFEPCMMCAGAIVVAGVETLVMGGNYNPNFGQYGCYSVEKAFELLDRGNIQVIRGIMVAQCEAITWSHRARTESD